MIRFVLSVLVIFAVLIVFGQIRYHDGYNKAKHKYCQHGESSTAGEFKTVNGKRTFVVTQPAHRTGC